MDLGGPKRVLKCFEEDCAKLRGHASATCCPAASLPSWDAVSWPSMDFGDVPLSIHFSRSSASIASSPATIPVWPRLVSRHQVLSPMGQSWLGVWPSVLSTRHRPLRSDQTGVRSPRGAGPVHRPRSSWGELHLLPRPTADHAAPEPSHRLGPRAATAATTAGCRSAATAALVVLVEVFGWCPVRVGEKGRWRSRAWSCRAEEQVRSFPSPAQSFWKGLGEAGGKRGGG